MCVCACVRVCVGLCWCAGVLVCSALVVGWWVGVLVYVCVCDAHENGVVLICNFAHELTIYLPTPASSKGERVKGKPPKGTVRPGCNSYNGHF